jgi:hypothetical protein
MAVEHITILVWGGKSFSVQPCHRNHSQEIRSVVEANRFVLFVDYGVALELRVHLIKSAAKKNFYIFYR